MKKTIILTLLVWVSMCGVVMGESLTNAQRHAFNVEALRMLENYEEYSGLRDDVEKSYFRSLFPEQGIYLYNDLLGLSDADSIQIDRYIDLMGEKARNTLVKIKNIRKSGFREDKNNWLMMLTFEKEILMTTSCGAIIDAAAYYGGDYIYEAVVAMDKVSNDMFIISLKAKPAAPKRHLPTDFTFVELVSPLDSAVTSGGKRLKFSHGQALVARDAEFSYSDDDANMKVHNVGDAECSHYTFSFHPMRWRVKAHADISLGKPYSLGKADLIDSSVSATDLGVDVGYMFPSKSKFKIGVFAGIGYSTGAIDLNVGKLEYNYEAPSSADIDGDTYRRYYELSGLGQKMNLNFFSVPVYADFEYRFSRRIAAYVNLGVKAYFNAGSKVSEMSGESYSYGVYPQYDNLVISDSDYNGFGASEITASSLEGVDIKGFSLDLLAGLGAEVKIVGPLSVYLGVSYQLGVTDVMTPPSDIGTMVSGDITESQAPVTYQVANGTSVKSLTDYLGSIKRNSLKLNAGLVYKF